MKKNTLKKEGDFIVLSESKNKDGEKTGEVRMTLKAFNGRRFLDIRKFFVNEDGEMQFTAKGIALSTPGLVMSLRDSLKEHEKAITAYLKKD